MSTVIEAICRAIAGGHREELLRPRARGCEVSSSQVCRGYPLTRRQFCLVAMHASSSTPPPPTARKLMNQSADARPQFLRRSSARARHRRSASIRQHPWPRAAFARVDATPPRRGEPRIDRARSASTRRRKFFPQVVLLQEEQRTRLGRRRACRRARALPPPARRSSAAAARRSATSPPSRCSSTSCPEAVGDSDGGDDDDEVDDSSPPCSADRLAAGVDGDPLTRRPSRPRRRATPARRPSRRALNPRMCTGSSPPPAPSLQVIITPPSRVQVCCVVMCSCV